MAKTLIILYVFTIISSLGYPNDKQNTSKAIISGNHLKLKRDLKYLIRYEGLYANDIKLLGNNPLTKRLKGLMKNRYDFLKNTWAVETPIEIKNNTFSAWGCQQHNCSNTNFIIVVDFTKNVVYVGIREEEKIKIYSEDGTSNKQVLKWANRN